MSAILLSWFAGALTVALMLLFAAGNRRAGWRKPPPARDEFGGGFVLEELLRLAAIAAELRQAGRPGIEPLRPSVSASLLHLQTALGLPEGQPGKQAQEHSQNR